MKGVMGFSFKCVVCGTVREEKYHDITHKYLYCSRKCSGFAHRGANTPGFKGKQKIAGYYYEVCHGHPRSMSDGLVAQHFLVVEKVIGHYLPYPATVHHINEVKTDNRPGNLVVCQDERYHQLLHARINRKKKFGSPDLKRCDHCGEIKPLVEFAPNEKAIDDKDANCLLCFKPKELRKKSWARNKTHCKKGHPFEGDNLTYDTGGGRVCITCRREWGRLYMQEKRREAKLLK